ncbi:glycine cleavage system T protein [Zopfia rhizophila CBS 207.26]|uniref:Aminomethyltransferase n=1 Tax=Zopfia rhizophila CBS 207.26 TaxID=1314779 RepID=A0A6A6EG55_9PEZI|nr:glycine cleavage system T protein [Zopfia rhizophila CBS 207.26]
MCAKRSMSVLWPALNGIGSRFIQANCPLKCHFIARPFSIHTSRPRRPSSIIPRPVRYSSSKADSSELAKTSLYDLHAEYGAKFVPFGGYSMPVQYKDMSIIESHNWTREKASLFDVGHMVQHEFNGPGAEAFLQTITPSSLSTLKQYHSTLSCLLHPQTGGIVDDTVITRLPYGVRPSTQDKFYVVTNVGCREKDRAYLAAQLEAWNKANSDSVEWTVLEDRGLIAVQGPKSSKVLLSCLTEDTRLKVESLYFGQSTYAVFTGGNFEVLVSRGGYTGEDGFEISIPANEVKNQVTIMLRNEPDLRLAGLGARDTLRLEAGMCLYGHDLDDSTTPVEAALSWIVGKDRREKGGFHGDSVIMQQLKKKSEGGGVFRRRVGFIVEGAPAREGAEIVNEAGEKIGNITSGCPSPVLKKNIAMGYIKDGLHKAGTEVEVVVRGKRRKATVTKMPFVPSKYHKAPSGK